MFHRPPATPQLRVAPLPDLSIPAGLNSYQQIEATKSKNLELAQFLDQRFPQHEETLVAMGNAYQMLGQNTNAEQCWTRALNLNPRRTDVYDALALIAIKKGDHARAIELWKKVLELDPYHPQAHPSLAQAYIRQGNHPEAMQVLTNAIKWFPNSALCWALCGQEYQRQNDFPQAKQCYEKAIELDPNSVQSYYGLGTVCTRLSLPEQARKYLDRFNQIKGEDTKKLIDRRHDYDDQDKVEKDFALTCIAAGAIFQKQGELESAKTCYQRATQLAWNHGTVLNHLAIAYHAAGQIEDAIVLRRRIAEIAPQDALNLFHMGGLLLEVKQPAEAQAAFAKVTTIAPQFSGSYRELARLELQRQRNFGEALALAEKAIQLEPAAMNFFVLSWALDKNGNHPEALQAIKHAVDLEPDNAHYQQVYRLALQQKRK
jgi:tetratricopeptide (TPR) repeat protein